MKKKIYPLVINPFRNKDLFSAIKSIRTGNLTTGNQINKFENIFSKKLKLKKALMVNSGSSANLLAVQCIINPYRKKRIHSGDEVLIPTICWSTSLWPIVQSGLKPVFVDIDPTTLNIDLQDLRKKINKKTKAMMLVHVLGNSANMDELMKIIKKEKIILIEDTCESLGSKYKNKYLGSFGDFSSFSFYSSHQISSGEGGMITCKTTEDYEILKALRSHGWSRGLKNENQISKQNKKLDSRFIFYNSGFNLRSTEVSATLGISQFRDMDKLNNLRTVNRAMIIKAMLRNKKINKNLTFIEANKFVKPSWFGIPIIIKSKNKKKQLIKNLEAQGIETRPIISGNFLRQPAIKKYKLDKGVKFKNADIVNEQGFFIGLHPKKLNELLLNKIVKIFEQSL
jgi:CDP-6-deoxy-D-xylo-4-hexulose-3-dehydrase